MSSMFDDVAAFQSEVLGVQPSYNSKGFRSVHERLEGLINLQEELNELTQGIRDQNLVDCTDALIDLIYFALGELYKMGIDADVVWKFVHAKNMCKVRGTTKRGNSVDAAKPEDWTDPKEQIEWYVNVAPNNR